MVNLITCDGTFLVDNQGNFTCDGVIGSVSVDILLAYDNLAIALNTFAPFFTFDVEVASYISGGVLLFWATGYFAGNIIARMRR